MWQIGTMLLHTFNDCSVPWPVNIGNGSNINRIFFICAASGCVCNRCPSYTARITDLLRKFKDKICVIWTQIVVAVELPLNISYFSSPTILVYIDRTQKDREMEGDQSIKSTPVYIWLLIRWPRKYELPGRATWNLNLESRGRGNIAKHSTGSASISFTNSPQRSIHRGNEQAQTSEMDW